MPDNSPSSLSIKELSRSAQERTPPLAVGRRRGLSREPQTGVSDSEATHLLEMTLVHLPHIGPKRERALWERGVRSWQQLADALTAYSVRSPSSPIHPLASAAGGRNGTWHGLVDQWLSLIERSKESWEARQLDFFLGRLRPSQHWRILSAILSDVLYLDIETTGLSIRHNRVTVIGVAFHGRVLQWAWPEPLDGLRRLIEVAPLVVTFNGQRFDLPFLSEHIPGLPRPRAHVDLRYLAATLGLRGGQKQAEAALGLVRRESVRDTRGSDAVAFWFRALAGDADAFDRLLAYNLEDVEMLEALARQLCARLSPAFQTTPRADPTPTLGFQKGKQPTPLSSVRAAWHECRPSVKQVVQKARVRLGREPVVVGIDLRGNPNRPTGWAAFEEEGVRSSIVFSDEELIELTTEVHPDVVSIDAPLCLPRGRASVWDDSPCRASGGIVRDIERALWSRRIPAYPALIRHMQSLTHRGVQLSTALTRQGLHVIESYPGAAQDILGILRKRSGVAQLQYGLEDLGVELKGPASHDELDAITSALVGLFYLAGDYESVGADDEGHLIVPRAIGQTAWPLAEGQHRKRPAAISVVGLPGSGKTSFARELANRLGWPCLAIGNRLRAVAATDMALRTSLEAGALAPEELVLRIVEELVAEGHQAVVLDGFPRHSDQLAAARQLFEPLMFVHLVAPYEIIRHRADQRFSCNECGWVGQDIGSDGCPACGSKAYGKRRDDSRAVFDARLASEQGRQAKMMARVTEPVFSGDAVLPLEVGVSTILQPLIRGLQASAELLGDRQ